jgi:hypothetical protein
MLVRQVFYYLSHSSGPFFSGYLEMGSHYSCPRQPRLLVSYFRLPIITELTGAQQHTHFCPSRWDIVS